MMHCDTYILDKEIATTVNRHKPDFVSSSLFLSQLPDCYYGFNVNTISNILLLGDINSKLSGNVFDYSVKMNRTASSWKDQDLSAEHDYSVKLYVKKSFKVKSKIKSISKQNFKVFFD